MSGSGVLLVWWGTSQSSSYCIQIYSFCYLSASQPVVPLSSDQGSTGDVTWPNLSSSSDPAFLQFSEFSSSPKAFFCAFTRCARASASKKFFVSDLSTISGLENTAVPLHYSIMSFFRFAAFESSLTEQARDSSCFRAFAARLPTAYLLFFSSLLLTPFKLICSFLKTVWAYLVLIFHLHNIRLRSIFLLWMMTNYGSRLTPTPPEHMVIAIIVDGCFRICTTNGDG